MNRTLLAALVLNFGLAATAAPAPPPKRGLSAETGALLKSALSYIERADRLSSVGFRTESLLLYRNAADKLDRVYTSTWHDDQIAFQAGHAWGLAMNVEKALDYFEKVALRSKNHGVQALALLEIRDYCLALPYPANLARMRRVMQETSEVLSERERRTWSQIMKFLEEHGGRTPP